MNHLATGPGRIDFGRVAQAALMHSETICRRWTPDGRLEGHEWVAINPKRADRRRGSFKINLRTGRWSDFATGDGGHDLVSLAAYLFDLRPRDAAIKVAEMVGVHPYAG